MRILANPAAKVVSQMARPGGPSSLLRSTKSNKAVQSLSYHSTSVANNQSVRGGDLSSSSVVSWMRDPELDPRHWGYRVVVPSASTNRPYTTSSISALPTSAGEDYDEYTLHTTPPEGTFCDLGTLGGGGPTSDADVVLHFDDAGFVRPIWDTAGSSHDSATLSEEDWNLNYHNDSHSHNHETKEVAPAEESVEDDTLST